MLTPRQSLVLKYIVEIYVETAEPVSSKMLLLESKLNCSSATIRNEMANLEEAGYIQKTHTSSGRVPSTKGYRYYVDNLSGENDPIAEDFKLFDNIFKKEYLKRDDAIKEAVKILSDITNYTSIALGPNANKYVVKKIQFIPLNERAAVMILVTNSGHVQTQNIILPEEIEISQVEKTVGILNDTLAGVSISEILEKLETEFRDKIKDYINYYDSIIDTFFNAFLAFLKDEKYYLGGKNNILAQPEFNDLEKLRKLFDLIEKKGIAQLLENTSGETKIVIGDENNLVDYMENCTVISAPYQVGDDNFGSIAILGPTRMDYSRIIPILNYIAKQIENIYVKDKQKKLK